VTEKRTKSRNYVVPKLTMFMNREERDRSEM